MRLNMRGVTILACLPGMTINSVWKKRETAPAASRSATGERRRTGREREGCERLRRMSRRGPKSGELVLVGQHDREDAGRNLGIRRIWRHQLHFTVVVVDLQEAADVAVLDHAEVVLFVWVVIFGEGVEQLYFREDRFPLRRGQCFDASGDDDGSACKSSTEGIVEMTDSRDGIRAVFAHRVLHFFVESKGDPARVPFAVAPKGLVGAFGSVD